MRVFSKIAGFECSFCGNTLPFSRLWVNNLRLRDHGYSSGVMCKNCNVKSRVSGTWPSRTFRMLLAVAILAALIAPLYLWVYPEMVAGRPDLDRLIFWLGSIIGVYILMGVAIRILFKVEPAT